MSADRSDRGRVARRLDHASELRPVALHDHVADPPQAQRAQRVPLHLRAADPRLDLGALYFCHDRSPAPAAIISLMTAPPRPLRSPLPFLLPLASSGPSGGGGRLMSAA